MNIINWTIQHYQDILLIIMGLVPVLEVIVRLTPSERDNSILNWVKRFMDKNIPNKTIKK